MLNGTRLRKIFIALLMTMLVAQVAVPASALAQETVDPTVSSEVEDAGGAVDPSPSSAEPGASATPTSTPTVASDQADYMPGELVTLRGEHWEPGEAVRIVVDDQEGRSWQRDTTVTADAEGRILDQFNLPDWFVAVYSVRAAAPSGSATTTFTDGNVRIQSSPSGVLFDLTYTPYTGSDNCSTGAGSPNTVVVGSANNNDLQVASGAGDSLRVQAAAVSTSNPTAPFSGWTTPEGVNTFFVIDSRTLCISGFSTATRTYRANYVNGNAAPEVTFVDGASSSPVTVAEGSTATNTGSWSDANFGDSVTLSASSGSVTQSGTTVHGDWAWSFGTTDGPIQSRNVTITATDNSGLSDSVSFPLTVTNVTPSLTSPGNQSASTNLSRAFNLGSFVDPGADSPWSVTVTWGDGSPATTFAAGSAGSLGTLAHTYTTIGNKTVNVSVRDKDGATGSISFTVNVTTPAQAPTTLSVASASGTYGGTASFSATLRRSSDSSVVSGKTINFTRNGTSVGSATTNASGVATLSGVSLSGVNAGTYASGVGASFATDSTHAGSAGTNSLTVLPKNITGSFTAQSKTYDGTTGATVTSRALSGAIAGDAVSLTGGTATFADRNVGSDKTVTLSGATLTGAHAGNYNLTLVGTATADITAKDITGSFAAENKTYDGNASATVTTWSRALSGKVSDDDVTLIGGTATFANRDVDNDKIVTLAGASLTGTDAGNYSLSMNTATADITAKQITGSFEADDKTYDGTTSATVTSGSRFLSGTIAGDAVSLTGGTAAFADKTVGNGKTVTLNGAALSGSDATNYDFTSVDTTTADITAKQITGSFTAANKVYDGNTDAAVTGRSLDGVITDDTVSLSSGTATFGNKNVGNGKMVTLIGATLDGADAGNYSLSMNTATADITAKPITGSFAAENKTYDGNTSAIVTTDSRALSGTILGDSVSLTGGTAAFADKNVGNGKTVSLTGATLSGGDAGNYSLTSVGASTANITAKQITGSFGAASKTYDGNANATVTSRSLSGTIAGDNIGLTGGAATFDNKNVGNGKTVTLSGTTLSGTDAANYTLTSVSTTVANITPAPLTIVASSPGSILLGSPVPTISPSYAGFVAGESAGTALSAAPTCGTAYTTASPVGTYTTNCSGATATSGNYSISYVGGTLTVLFAWNGFLQPINDTAHQTSLTQSKFKLGQTIPVKFAIKNAAGVVVQQSPNPTFTRSSRVGGCEPDGILESTPTLAPDAGAEFKWDGNQYHYNWSTKGITASGVYRIFANLSDGTTRSVDICLTK